MADDSAGAAASGPAPAAPTLQWPGRPDKDARAGERPATGEDRPATVASSTILSHSQVQSRQRQRSMFMNEQADAAKREEDDETLRKLRRELMARTALNDEKVSDDNRSLLVLVHEYRDKYEAQAAELRNLRAQLEEQDN